MYEDFQTKLSTDRMLEFIIRSDPIEGETKIFREWNKRQYIMIIFIAEVYVTLFHSTM